VFDRQSKLFGDDCSRVRSCSGAQILRADRNEHRTVTRDRHINFALVVSAAAPNADSATHAPLKWTSVTTCHRIPSGPSDLLCATPQLPVIDLITQVLDAKLDRIHLDLPGKLIDE